MHFRIERPSSRGITQRGECFRMASLLGERDSQIEQGNGVPGSTFENDSKGAFGLRELFLLQEFPPCREGDVGIVRMVVPTTPDRGGDERSHTHASPHSHSLRQGLALTQVAQRERLDTPQTPSSVPA
jgi:hypothetical protein